LIHVDDFLAACIISGTGKSENHSGNGDCLLIDMAGGFFAASDASDRCPRASRIFLKRLCRSVRSDTLDHHVKPVYPHIQHAWNVQPYVQKTTFSSVSIQKKEKDLCLGVCHGGDSMVVVYEPENGRVIHRSRVDMNFAGRSKTPPGITWIPATPSCRVILATDGLNDILGIIENREPVPDMLRHPSCSHVIERLIGEALQIRFGNSPHDDIGLIVMYPLRLNPAPSPAILIGGTLASEEKRFGSGGVDDNWFELHSGNHAMNELNRAGVLVLE